MDEDPKRLETLCGKDGTGCDEEAMSLWKLTQDMAQAAYDTSPACTFTAFIAYEYTGTPRGNNIHRNVIFRNDKVPDRAISYVEAPTDKTLWQQLESQCLNEQDGCDVLAIPHNSNLSSGMMFPAYAAGFENKETAYKAAQLRNAMEPVMEIFQHKSNSECFNGFPDVLGDVDELCDIEQFRSLGERRNFTGGAYTVEICNKDDSPSNGFGGFGCISKNDFYRTVLLTGMQDHAAIGINSYKLGAIGSTDTHLGLAGHTSEHGWAGHLLDETVQTERLKDKGFAPRSITANPGGLAGIWAIENSRDALFDALRQREVFGTTGTRIKPRLFAGWSYDQGACGRADLAAYGYKNGVPMGSDMRARPKGARPVFIAAATQDPNAAPLQKLQLIKGWVDAAGQSHVKVIDVAGKDNKDRAIDLATGQWSGNGEPSFCAVFEDEEFRDDNMAYYYLRAVEVPTLRWSWSQCAALSDADKPLACTNEAPKTTQELAWTSPIWYTPGGTQ